jgi:hypothetical protein
MVLFMWSADVDANLTVRPTVMDQKKEVRNKRDGAPLASASGMEAGFGQESDISLSMTIG